MSDNVLTRILERAGRGAERGWNPRNPVGLNPQWDRELREAGVTRPYNSMGTPMQAANELVINGGASLLDLAAKSAGAVYGAGVGALGGAADELGVSNTRALERDLMAIPEAISGNIGGLGGLGGTAVATGNRLRQETRMRPQPEFHRGQNGSINLGHITPEVSEASGGRVPVGPIRMEIGEAGPEGYGALHISPDKHTRAQNLGYSDGLGLIEDVAQNYDTVLRQPNSRLMAIRQNTPEGTPNRQIVTEYQDRSLLERLLRLRDEYHGVTTGFPDNSTAVKRPQRSDMNRAINNGAEVLWRNKP